MVTVIEFHTGEPIGFVDQIMAYNADGRAGRKEIVVGIHGGKARIEILPEGGQTDATK